MMCDISSGHKGNINIFDKPDRFLCRFRFILWIIKSSLIPPLPDPQSDSDPTIRNLTNYSDLVLLVRFPQIVSVCRVSLCAVSPRVPDGVECV